MKKQALAFAVAAALGVTGAAYAQDTSPKSGTTAAQDKVDRDTQKFFEQAAQGGMAEVELGKLASGKAVSPEVKQFAERMVQDHGKNNQELMQLASKYGVTPPSELEGKHKKARERLSGLSGVGFDRAYMDQMVKDHKDTIDLFEKQAKRGKQQDVKQLAQQTLPVLQEHLKQAQQIQKSLK